MRPFFHPLIIALLLIFLCPYPCQAHFGLLIPSSSTVTDKDEAELKFTIAFLHPFEQKTMPMAKPREFLVMSDGVKTSLADRLIPGSYLGQPAYTAEFKIEKPGVYAFGVVPEPYFETAEGRFIIHYAKVIVGAYGEEDGWHEPMGMPVEIVPLSRPFANYAGNTFTGQALKNGKPLKNAVVEVEFLNSDNSREAPNEYFVTQTILTDADGVFTFGVPWPGWWGFAVLTESDSKIDLNGKAKSAELGGIIWVEFSPVPQVKNSVN